MKLSLAGAAAAFLLLSAAPAAAQVAVEANVAKSEGQWGGEIGAGYSVISIGGFRITPGGGVFIYDRDTTGYANDGDERCRNVETGDIVGDSRCDSSATKLYGRVEATYTLPVAGLTIGTGGRLFSGKLRPYGTVALPLMPLLNIKGNVGPKYVAAGLQARF